MTLLNYFYDPEIGVFELYYGDTLIVELPHADKMTKKQAEELANTLFQEYLEAAV